MLRLYEGEGKVKDDVRSLEFQGIRCSTVYSHRECMRRTWLKAS